MMASFPPYVSHIILEPYDPTILLRAELSQTWAYFENKLLELYPQLACLEFAFEPKCGVADLSSESGVSLEQLKGLFGPRLAAIVKVGTPSGEGRWLDRYLR